MPGSANEFRLRAVITEAEAEYVVSVSKASSENGIEILKEREVDTIEEAHRFIEETARLCSYPVADVDKLYNIAGRIGSKPPRGRK